MIYSLRGTLVKVEQNFLVVECAGVGYGVRTSANTVGRLPKMGQEVRVLTHLSVREDAVELFGFLDPQELALFRMLTSVAGVGPKAAVAILSELAPERLMLTVAAGDAKALTRAPGVGAKLAGRIVLELRDKISGEDLTGGLSSSSAAPPPAQSNAGEAVSALVALGYGPSEAAAAVSKQKDQAAAVQDLIKGALKQLAKQS